MTNDNQLVASALKKPAEMPFAAFAEAVKPTAAVNRFPAIGPGMDVYSYTVYMNGPLVAALPAHAREHTFKDVTIHALTEKLQLNPLNARDNLKVAEVAQLRSAWMSAVLESSVEPGFKLSDAVAKDYELLTNALEHPWIQEELAQQRLLSARIRPTLERASQAVGTSVKDVIPKEVSVGEVVAQDLDFTVQKTRDGEVVTHENRRLSSVPEVGAEVTVSYYRGSGQVVASLENVKESPPFVDPISGDLAIMLEDGAGLGQMVLFNSVSGFDKFIKAHGMDADLMRQAMDVRAVTPKPEIAQPRRELTSAPYLDPESQCLAVDYRERGVPYTAMFRSAGEMGTHAQEFGLGTKPLAIARALEDARSPKQGLDSQVHSSLNRLLEDLADKGVRDFKDTGAEGHTYVGKVIAASALHVAQDLGRGQVAVHSKAALDKVPAVGDSLSIKFHDGRGRVSEMTKAARDVGR